MGSILQDAAAVVEEKSIPQAAALSELQRFEPNVR